MFAESALEGGGEESGAEVTVSGAGDSRDGGADSDEREASDSARGASRRWTVAEDSGTRSISDAAALESQAQIRVGLEATGALDHHQARAFDH